ncbi:glycosyltransferase family 4 protein [Vibrio sp. FJH11]
MKILYIDNSQWWGGAEECLKRYLYAEETAAWEVKVCAPFPSEHLEQYKIESQQFIYRHSKIKKWMPEAYTKAPKGLDRINKIIRSKKLNRILKAENPDVVYFNLLRFRDIWDIKEVKKLGCKIVLHIRNLFHQAGYSKELLDLADLIICTSDIVSEQARNTGTKTRVIRIYDGLDSKLEANYDKDLVRQELNIPKDSIVGLFPAVIEPRKGQDLAIEAFRLLASDLPNSNLVIAGGCNDSFIEYGKKIKRMVKDSPDSIRLLGHQKDMNKLYSMADYVLALSYDGEAYGLVPVEAGQHHLPVIATCAGATPELVVDKQTGVLVNPGEAQEVADAIKFMHSETIRKSLGEAAFKRVRTCFDLKQGLSELRAAVESII